METLFKKLKAKAENNNIPVFDAFMLNVNHTNDVNVNKKIYILVKKVAGAPAPVIKGFGNTFFIGENEYDEYPMDLTVSQAGYENTIEVKNADYNIAICNAKNNIISMNYNQGGYPYNSYTPIISFDLSQFDFSEYLTSFITTIAAKTNIGGSFNAPVVSELTSFTIHSDDTDTDVSAFEGASALTLLNCMCINLRGNLSSLAGCTSLETLNLNGSKVEGNISSLSSLTSLKQLTVTDCVNIKGTVESLANALAPNKTSGSTLKIYAKNSKVTYNESPIISSGVTITFDGEGGWS